jgi:hypothetical protein
MLKEVPSYGILVTGTLDPFPAVPLVFAWAQSNETPVILGQQNFFKEFNVHFYGSQNIFEIAPKVG